MSGASLWGTPVLIVREKYLQRALATHIDEMGSAARDLRA